MKIGRNDSCSCGSGKKFKRCCGFAEGTVNSNLRFSLKPITEVDYKKSKLSEGKADLYRRWGRENIKTNLLSDNARADALIQELGVFLSLDAIVNPLETMDHEFYKRISVEIGPPGKKLANQIYWNEIDQRHRYFVSTSRNLLSSRIQALLNNMHDHVTVAIMTRQLLEIIWYLIRHHYLISLQHLNMTEVLAGKFFTKEQDYHLFEALAGEFENYLISITHWPDETLKEIESFSKFEFDEIYASDATLMKIEPSETRQLIESIEKDGLLGFLFDKGELKPLLDRLVASYHFLCKFVHSSTLLYPEPREGLSETVKTAVTNIAFDSLYFTVKIGNGWLYNPKYFYCFQKMRDEIEEEFTVSMQPTKGRTINVLTSEVSHGVFLKLKGGASLHGVELESTDGISSYIVPPPHVQGVSKPALKIAKQIDTKGLSDVEISQVGSFVQSLHSHKDQAEAPTKEEIKFLKSLRRLPDKERKRIQKIINELIASTRRDGT